MANNDAVTVSLRLDPKLEPDVIDFFSGMRKSDKHGVTIQAIRMLMNNTGFYEKQLLQEMHGSNRPVPVQAGSRSKASTLKPVQTGKIIMEDDLEEMIEISKAI